MKKLIASLLFVLAIASPVFAQDTVPAPEVTETPELILDQPPSEPIVDVPEETAPVFTPPAPNDVANGVLLALFSLFATAIASPLTAPIVSLIKRLPFLQRFTGDQINLGVAGALSIIAWGAASLGFAGELDTVYRLIFAVLPILTATGGNFAANQKVFDWGQAHNVPILSYTRSKKYS